MAFASLKKRIRSFAIKSPEVRAVLRPPLAQAPTEGAHRMVFLVGLHRSGTSLIHRILRRHPLITGFANTGAREDEGQHLQDVLPTGQAFGGTGRFAFHVEAHMTADDPRATPQTRDLLMRQWGPWLDLDKPVIIEKSPPNLTRTTFLQALFPNAAFVFIVRHPVPVGLATSKWSKTSLVELVLHWAVAHRIAQADLPSLRSATVMRYEDFIRDPEGEMTRICRFLGIEPVTISESVADHNERYFANAEVPALADRSIFNLDDGIFSTFGYRLERPFIDPQWKYGDARCAD